jgi:hypothetical protein
MGALVAISIVLVAVVVVVFAANVFTARSGGRSRPMSGGSR